MESKLKSLLKKEQKKNIGKQFYFHQIFQSKFSLRLADVFVYLLFDFRFLNFDRIGDVTMILHELSYTLL